MLALAMGMEDEAPNGPQRIARERPMKTSEGEAAQTENTEA